MSTNNLNNLRLKYSNISIVQSKAFLKKTKTPSQKKPHTKQNTRKPPQTQTCYYNYSFTKTAYKTPVATKMTKAAESLKPAVFS